MKRLRLIFTTLSLCIAVGLMAFGVYSATTVTATVTGSIQYQVSDAFVDIRTKVYKSERYLNSAEIAQYVNELTESDFNTVPDGLKFHSESGTFSSTPEEESDYIYDLQDLSFVTKTNPAYAYFFVVNIVNKSTELNVWSIMDDSAVDYVSNPYDDDIDDEETALLEIENTVQINNGAQTHIDTNGKNMVIALGLDDYAKNVEQKEFNYQINIGTGDLATQQFNTNKLTINSNTVSANSGAKGVAVIPEKNGETTITTIASSAFANTYLTNVILPDTITTLQTQSFANCNLLAKVSIPETVKSINASTFVNCPSLIAIEFGKLVESTSSASQFTAKSNSKLLEIKPFADIDISDFDIALFVNSITNCDKLTNITFSGSDEVAFEQNFSLENINLKIININFVYPGHTFDTFKISSEGEGITLNVTDKCKSLPIIKGNIKSINVEEENTIYTDADANCVIHKSEKKLILASNTTVIPTNSEVVTRIQFGSFENCNLKNLIIPSNLVEVEDIDTSLENLYIANSSIQVNFNGDYNDTSNRIKNLYFDGTYEEWTTKITFYYVPAEGVDGNPACYADNFYTKVNGEYVLTVDDRHNH